MNEITNIGIEAIIAIFIAIGTLFSFVTAIGLIRLPDVYTRTHAASKSATLGVLFILVGTFLYFWLMEGHVNTRILVGVFFIFLTSPVAGHLIARAAYNSGVKLWEKTKTDELGSDDERVKTWES